MNALSRRTVLKMMATGTCGAAIHHILQPLQPMMAFAAPAIGGLINDPVFILVNLDGGSSYNIANPIHGAYMDKNPTLAYDVGSAFAISPEQVIHPSLSLFHRLFEDRQLAVINMVGYPDPNRSHAESADIWKVGFRDGHQSDGGWAARLTCQMAGVFSGVSLAGADVLVRGGCNPPRAIGNLDSFGEDRFKYNTEWTDWLRITRENILRESAPANAGAQHVWNSIESIERTVDILRAETDRPLPEIANPFPNTSFGRSCEDAARLIAAPALGSRFLYIRKGGFDTHSGERSSLTGLLNDVDQGLTALVDTVKALGRWQNVIICTMSEFGRTFENGSAGTDHGHANVQFVMGGSVAGGVKTPAPGITETLNHGFYRDYHVDFRQTFREIINAMGYDPEAVFPESSRKDFLGLF